MAEQQDVVKDLEKYAKWLVARLDWGRDHGRKDDAEQELLLAGWQVWLNEGNVALAKHRMKSRTANLLRDFGRRKKRETTFTDHASAQPDDGGDRWSENSIGDHRKGPAPRDPDGDSPKNAAIRRFMDRLSERQRRIVLLRNVGRADEQIADELGVSLRTVERERALLRKEYRDEFGE